jgi:hypothetical protein
MRIRKMVEALERRQDRFDSTLSSLDKRLESLELQNKVPYDLTNHHGVRPILRLENSITNWGVFYPPKYYLFCKTCKCESPHLGDLEEVITWWRKTFEVKT